METKRLLWVIALVFSVILLLQYIELPYGYVLSSSLPFGRSKVTSSGSWLTRVFSNSPISSMNADSEVVNKTEPLEGSNEFGKQDESPLRDSLALSQAATDEGVARNMNLVVGKKTNASVDKLQASNGDELSKIRIPQIGFPHANRPSQLLANSPTGNQSLSPGTSSMDNSTTNMFPNSGTPELAHNNRSAFLYTSSVNANSHKIRASRRPPAVVPFTVMNEMLRQSHVSYLSVKPHWTSQADKELLHARTLIESAGLVQNIPHLDFNVYRNYSAFIRSYELMERTLKIYIYSEGERPIFHQPELSGIYASEGWFMKRLEENKHFVTRNCDKAHLFYLPFSTRLLQETLYIPNLHSRKNLVQYLSSYLQNITTKYPFWNRTNGADHFLVACHDWAPAETDQIMKHCIRSLCNSDVKRRFQFGKDVSLPQTYVRYPMNPLKGLGGKFPNQRHILAFFAGNMHGYVRPILLKYWEKKDPDMMIFGKLKGSKNQMSYTQYMKNSKYCISAKGYEAYTPRVMEAIFYECVPVIISDNYVPPFFETLNWESFSIFILEKDIPNLKTILLSIPEQSYLKMQQRVRQVQKHFLWHPTPVKQDIFHMILHSVWHTRVFQVRPS